jgi:hypothetical protein
MFPLEGFPFPVVRCGLRSKVDDLYTPPCCAVPAVIEIEIGIGIEVSKADPDFDTDSDFDFSPI